MGGHSAYAQSYKIQLKTFDACGIYESTCVAKDKTCFSKLNFPFEKNGKYASIDVDISIKNQSVNIDFKSGEQTFSVNEGGWDSFDGKLADFFARPRIVELYFPNPAIKSDPGFSMPLVVRKANAFVTAVLIDIQPVPAPE